MEETLVVAETARRSESASEAPLGRGWGLLRYAAVLFLVFQVAAALTLRPGGHFTDTSDTGYYSTWGLLSYRGLYPYVHYWVEYPPVVPWLALLVFRLTAWLPRGDVWGLPDLWFRLAMAGISALASTGILVLVYRLGRLCWRSDRLALRGALTYGLAFVPLFVVLGHMDVLPLFLLLLSLDLTLRQRSWAGGVVAGIGVLTKLYPGVVVLAALRVKGRWRWLAGGAAAIAVGLAPFAVVSPQYLLASGRAMLSRRPWETVWALLQGYYSYGTLDGDRFDAAAVQQGGSPGLPYLLCLVAVAALTLYLFWRTRQSTNRRDIVAVIGFAVAAMLLVYSGYSPQFAVWLVPFVAILLPHRRGAFYLTALTAVMLAERLLYFVVLPESHALLVAIITARSLLFLTLALEMLVLAVLGRPWSLSRQARRYGTVAAAVLVTVVLAVGGVWAVKTQMLPRYRAMNRLAPVLDAVNTMGSEASGVIVTSEEAFALIRPYLGGRQPFLVTYQDRESAERWQTVSANLQAFLRQHDYAWLVLDNSITFNADLNRDIANRAGVAGYMTYERWFEGGVWAGCYALGEPARWQRVGGAEFAADLQLEGASVEEGPVVASDAVRLSLSWRATAVPTGDLSVFVHLVGEDGKPATQTDTPLADADWAVDTLGATVEQRLALSVPEGTAPGSYDVVIGVYSSGSGERLTLADGRDCLTLSTVTVLSAAG
ncbi:MAG: glycosyltransferase 87 family protein [Anaerolineae bacterium]